MLSNQFILRYEENKLVSLFFFLHKKLVDYFDRLSTETSADIWFCLWALWTIL